MTTIRILALCARLLAAAAAGPRAGQAPIEGELTLITPVSKFIHDAALKAFADYAKEKWNVTVKINAIPAGTPVAYGRIVEWKGRPDADIFWGGESALFEKLAEQKLLQKVEIVEGGVGLDPGLDRQAQAHPAQGQGRLLGRHRARAVRARLPPQEDPAARHPRAEGLGRPAESQAQGRGRPVRAHALVVVERDLRGHPVDVRRGQGLGVAQEAGRQHRPLHRAQP